MSSEIEIGGNKELDQNQHQSSSKLFEWEERIWQEGYKVVAGTDEAGRGPLAGPVVSGAFAVLDPQDEDVLSILRTVSDSKKMTAEEREKAFERLTDPLLDGKVVWAVSEMSAAKIDEMNILQASLASMAEAVRLLPKRPDCVLVDGCNRPPDLLKKGERWTRENKAAADPAQSKLTKFFTKVAQPPKEDAASNHGEKWLPQRVDAVIGGDAKVVCIAAASVLAKVHRDRVMDQLHKEYPAYGFGSHKGYGTASHVAAINKHGVCKEHRRSFEPVKSMLETGGAPSEDVCPSPSKKRKMTDSPGSAEKAAEPSSKKAVPDTRAKDSIDVTSPGTKAEPKRRGRPKKTAI
eukprot:gnl/MRDRNA2_/MRDRNA2_41782_c0_seq1.p1 gnl/MRDRNA2_/MRDRNA2_41782_c0~~gnl/MRDRNA2_/MRDRNA2_41782_c0_seq1.p1  ORF type:complete len:349 (+),score=81.55 gnl/MRDRNA2_/MRDRNA2_41782_c0_seq1:57-1103(+)